MRFLPVVAAVLLFAGTAQAQLTLCNRTNQPVEAAVVTEGDIMEPYTDGWKKIAPGKCEKVAHNMAVDYAYFARQGRGGKTWEGGASGPRLCLRWAADFSSRYEDLDDELLEADAFNCAAGMEKRSFIKLPNPNGNNYTIDLR